jgi:hypothetical protein
MSTIHSLDHKNRIGQDETGYSERNSARNRELLGPDSFFVTHDSRARYPFTRTLKVSLRQPLHG